MSLRDPNEESGHDKITLKGIHRDKFMTILCLGGKNEDDNDLKTIK